MPNWTDEDTGVSVFGKLECKRCFQEFASTSYGEIPEHSCLGGIFRSHSPYGECRVPEFVRPYRKGDNIYPPKIQKDT